MASGDTQPTVPLPEWRVAEPPRAKRGGGLGWLIAVVIVLGLLVAAWFAGEAIARSVLTDVIREQVVTRAGLPADQQVDVQVEGAVLPQLIVGSLADVTVSSEDVPFGSFVGDITVEAQDVPVRGGDWSGATATAVLDQEQLRAVLDTVDGFPADTVSLESPDVAIETELSFFGAKLPLGAALTPSAQDGEIVLTPASLTLGGAEVSADDLRERFGTVADTVLQGWSVCIADQMPAALTLTSIAVEDDQVVAVFDISSDIIDVPAASEPGECA